MLSPSPSPSLAVAQLHVRAFLCPTFTLGMPLLPPICAAEKVQRLKLAKQEAEAEIADYKGKREAQFATFSKERMGTSAGYTANISKMTEGELATISSDISKNKAKVIDMLLKSVTTVA